MRCFLAVPVREPALGEAGRLLESLRARVPAVRWARPATLHVTMHFFGTATDPEVAAALRAVEPVVRTARPFDVKLLRLGSFPPRGEPRVLWLGMDSAGEELQDLVARCRPRQRGPPEARRAWDAAAAETAELAVGFRADRLLLYESVTGRGGSV